jgi:integration host factor subunit beta
VVRADLVRKLLAEHSDLAARDIEKVVTAFFDAITSRLVDGGRVEIRGFGTFTTRAREARTGRNPRTGRPVAVTAKRIPCFRAGKELCSMIDAGAA